MRSFSSVTFDLNMFLSAIAVDYKASILIGFLKPGLSILFKSGPIRTQVYLHTERACKQTNKQTNTPTNKQTIYFLRVELHCPMCFGSFCACGWCMVLLLKNPESGHMNLNYIRRHNLVCSLNCI